MADLKPKITLMVTDLGMYVAKIHYDTPTITYPLRNSSRDELDRAIDKLKMALIEEILKAEVRYGYFF